MIGPILLAVSWLLLRFEGKPLAVLGFDAPRLRVLEFIAGFLVAGGVVVVQQLGMSLASGVAWQVNPDFSAAMLAHGLRWNLNSVLYEELLFRGYLLYQAIRWLGVGRAVALDAFAFGIYHWFSYSAFGNPVMMAFVLLYTGSFGLMVALAFAKTRSLATPVGLHLGWNLVSYLAFSAGPLGAGILLPANGAARMEANGPSGLLLNIGLPLLFVSVVCMLLLRHRTHALPSVEKAIGSPPT